MQQNYGTNKKFSITATLFVASIFIFAGLFIYGFMQISDLKKENQKLDDQLASVTIKLSDQTGVVASDVESLRNIVKELADIVLEYNQNAQSRFGGFEETVKQISGTVNTLEKLSKTDPEFLQKYSKIYFLNEHYTPQRVALIDKQYVYNEETPEQIHALVWPFLQNLLASARNSGVSLYVKSAYRSFDEQENLKSSYRVTYGAGTANQFSADQGYSEHQLGTTVDFTTTNLNGKLDEFETTEAYTWMRNNAHLYGFTLSYPENNTFYIFEPWHWRYVGVKLATFLHDQNRSFYDLDQREIDEFLINLFE